MKLIFPNARNHSNKAKLIKLKHREQNIIPMIKKTKEKSSITRINPKTTTSITYR